MLRVAFLSTLAVSAYGALELTPDNFDKEVKDSALSACNIGRQ